MYKLADGTRSTDYKVGDKFVVVADSSFFREGQVITLFSDDGSVCPWFDEEESPCHWYRLKAYKPKGFNLKDGMVVTYRDGGKRLIFQGGAYYSEDVSQKTIRLGFMLEKDFDDNLPHTVDSDVDIMKVEYMDEVLWERQEETPEQKEIKRLQGIIKEAQDALNVIDKGNKEECDE